VASDDARVTVADPRFANWFVGSLRSGLVAIDAQGDLVALSPEAARILGCPATRGRALLGRPCRELLRHQAEVAALLEGALDGRERPSRAELRLLPVAGREPCTIGYTLLAVRDTQGQVCGAAMVFRDLTPFERMDEQARLRERLQALGQMAAGLAHEIRNPLASMEVLAGLLKRLLVGRADELQLLEELIGELRALAATVTASLDFVRPIPIQREEVDPASLVEDALIRARSQVPFRGRVECEVAAGVGRVLADPDRMLAALTNLLVNALQAMAETERSDHVLGVRIEPDGERGGLVIRVSDTGPGVPEDLRERIFYPFFTTREQGSGVGLAEAQKVVAGHGGSIEVESHPSGGAAFHIYLPPPGAAP
jgi:signal transduction histidine kinase